MPREFLKKLCPPYSRSGCGVVRPAPGPGPASGLPSEKRRGGSATLGSHASWCHARQRDARGRVGLYRDERRSHVRVRLNAFGGLPRPRLLVLPGRTLRRGFAFAPAPLGPRGVEAVPARGRLAFRPDAPAVPRLAAAEGPDRALVLGALPRECHNLWYDASGVANSSTHPPSLRDRPVTASCCPAASGVAPISAASSTRTGAAHVGTIGSDDPSSAEGRRT